MAGTARLRSGRRFDGHDLLRLVDRAPDVVLRYRLRPPGFEFVSRAITHVAGYLPEELYSDPRAPLELVHPHDRAIVQELLERGTGHVPLVVRWLRKDGSVLWVEQRNTPVFNRSRELVAVESIAREIGDPTIGSQPHVRVLGNLRIDLDRGRVIVEGHEVHLTPSELRLLVLLTDQPGRTITRSMIVEALWNSSHGGSGRTCEVHISKLRGKLAGDRIETVRGRGYRFIHSG
jgi:PAS domain S-box-containing protein